MEELAKKINEVIADFTANLEKNLAGNKAAGARARKASVELEKLMKEYRKVSVKA